MRKINQNECINENFRNEPGIFNERFEYPLRDEQKKYNIPTSKVVDIQGPQTVQFYSLSERKVFIFDTGYCPYFHIAFTKPTFKEES